MVAYVVNIGYDAVKPYVFPCTELFDNRVEVECEVGLAKDCGWGDAYLIPCCVQATRHLLRVGVGGGVGERDPRGCGWEGLGGDKGVCAGGGGERQGYVGRGRAW